MRIENTFFCLKNDKVALYPFSYDELNSASYLKWMNDFDIVKTIGRNDYLMPVSHQKLIQYVEGINTETTLFLAIYYNENGIEEVKSKNTFVGTLKIYDIDFNHRRASLGILVGEKQFWGKSIASQAINLANSYIFNKLNFQKITAGCYSTNTGMKKAFEKNGFILEGVLKNHFFDSEIFQDICLVACFKGKP